MALSVTCDNPAGGVSKDVTTVGGSLRFATGVIGFDDSYPVGGETVDFVTLLNGAAVKGVIFESKSGYVFEYDYTNKKVKAMYADYDALADGALIEVPDKTDLSTVVGVRFLAWGI